MRTFAPWLAAAMFVATFARRSAAEDRPPPRGVPAYTTSGFTWDAPLPQRFPYREGETHPGYHVEERPRLGLVIGGAAGWGFAYTLGLFLAFQGEPELFVPFVGPMISASSAGPQEAKIADAILGIGQLAGLVVFGSGFVFKKKYFVRDEAAQAAIGISNIALGPLLFEGAKPGLALSASF